MSPDEIVSTLYRRYREEDRHQLREDAQTVLATPQGRRLIMAIVAMGGVYAPMGPESTAYDCGRRDAAAELLAHANRAARLMVQLAAQERTELCARREASIETAKKGTQP